MAVTWPREESNQLLDRERESLQEWLPGAKVFCPPRVFPPQGTIWLNFFYFATVFSASLRCIPDLFLPCCSGSTKDHKPGAPIQGESMSQRTMWFARIAVFPDNYHNK